METYRNEIIVLDSKMKRLEVLQKELQSNKFNVKKKTGEMEKEHKKKDLLLASVRKKRGSYKKMIKELEESSSKLLDMIKELKDEDVPTSISGKNGFAALRRRLPWPVTGKILVPYGTYKDPKFNISTFRKGIEINADIGDIVLSVSGGRVVYADWFKGYGLLLILNHGGGYHSLYAHLSEIFHKTGDIIKSRQAVGKIGETGLLNKPSLYFEIRHKGKPLNPMAWLRKRK
jgi:septal ring factor EnvC (AmiA/AmiB activator)